MSRKGTVRVPFLGSKAGEASAGAGDMYICTYYCHLKGTQGINMYTQLLGGTSIHHTAWCDTIYKFFLDENSVIIYTIYSYFVPGSTRHSSPPVATR